MKRKNSLFRRILRIGKRTQKAIVTDKLKENVSLKASKADTNKKDLPSIKFSDKVLDEFRENVGKYYPETGGMLASSVDKHLIDKCYFDVNSKNTMGTFYYDVDTMSKVYRNWKSKGYVTNGIFHSHPIGAIRPSYHDISTALLHLDFFKLDYFYLPIFQPKQNGQYQMYFYIVKKKE